MYFQLNDFIQIKIYLKKKIKSYKLKINFTYKTIVFINKDTK